MLSIAQPFRRRRTLCPSRIRLFGALIVGVMSMGLNMLNADPQWKVLLTGGLIIAAVAVDQWIRKVSG